MHSGFIEKLDIPIEYSDIQGIYTAYCEKYMTQREIFPFTLYAYPVDNE